LKYDVVRQVTEIENSDNVCYVGDESEELFNCQVLMNFNKTDLKDDYNSHIYIHTQKDGTG
jgi:hypothetical protein